MSFRKAALAFLGRSSPLADRIAPNSLRHGLIGPFSTLPVPFRPPPSHYSKPDDPVVAWVSSRPPNPVVGSGWSEGKPGPRRPPGRGHRKGQVESWRADIGAKVTYRVSRWVSCWVLRWRDTQQDAPHNTQQDTWGSVAPSWGQLNRHGGAKRRPRGVKRPEGRKVRRRRRTARQEPVEPPAPRQQQPKPSPKPPTQRPASPMLPPSTDLPLSITGLTLDRQRTQLPTSALPHQASNSPLPLPSPLPPPPKPHHGPARALPEPLF